MVVKGASDYTVGKPVAETATTRIYLCQDNTSGRSALLRIARERQHSGGLDREAYVLRELQRLSDATEAAYKVASPKATHHLHYDLLFPELLDSFICEDQGNRRINIVAFRNVDQISKLVPLSNLITKDRLRVDLRSSAWIMGRLLKLLSFVHGEGITVRTLGTGNIVLEPSKHYCVVFDWSAAYFHSGSVPQDERITDIAGAAKAVITALGGNGQTNHIPEAINESSVYTDYIIGLANRREANAERAHQRFYEIVDALWPREYYPFHTLPLVG